jgi:hypothetical protein
MNEFKTCMAEALKKGYVSIPLELIKWWIVRERKLTEFEAFFLMISLVNFMDNEVNVSGGKAICRRGESIRSIERWSDEFHWGMDETRKFFETLWEKGVLEVIEQPISKNHIRIAEYERLTGSGEALAARCAGGEALRAGGKGGKEEERSLFDDFWELYHEITHIKPTERTRTKAAWDKLTEEQQDQAIEGIEAYYAGLTLKKYCRKAATYLENQSFS